MARVFIYFLSIFLAFCICWDVRAGEKPQITSVRYWSAPDHTRIIFDITDSISYSYFSLANPQRFVIDFKNISPRTPLAAIAVDDAVVKQIRFGRFKPGVFRVVCDLIGPVEANIFTPRQYKAKPDRLVLELFRPELRKESAQARQKISKELKDKHIIVIDPGHGGEDPGAIGPGGTLEKDIVLDFSRSLRALFNKHERCEAFLTRYGDYFLTLRERTQIAEDYGAELFISIHTDSNRDRRLRGSSVYCLSLQGASDEASRCLAEEENAADLIGGIPFSQNDELNFMLLDLALNNTINSSLRLGSLMLREVEKVHTVKFDKPKQAGFVVLKAPEIPAVLVELGFLSNAKEERVLKQKDFHVSVGKALVDASEDFLLRMAKKNGGDKNQSTRKEIVLAHPQ